MDKEGIARQRTVQLGPVIEGLRVVREGIAPEDRVVVNGLQRLRPNLRVTAREQPAATAQAKPADRPEAQAPASQGTGASQEAGRSQEAGTRQGADGREAAEARP